MTFAPMMLNVLELKINAVDHAAVVNMGPSQHVDMFVTYKRNQGIGEQNGDISPILFSQSLVVDPDLSDSNAMKNSVV